MKKEIEEAIAELREAMLENLMAQKAIDTANLAKIKAHKRLLLAKDCIRNLEQVPY